MRLLFWRRPSTTSKLSTPPRRWAWLAGRRVLTNTPYVIPKDSDEGSRLDIQHHLFTLAAGGLYRAPVRQPRSILDVACGTGKWARDMAEQFPQARVIGIDIDASLPERAIEVLGPSGQFPQNFRFQVADALKPLPFSEAEFDFVHARLISPFVPIARWSEVVGEMVRVLRPGGVIELVDYQAAPLTPSPAYNRFRDAVSQFCDQRGVSIGLGESLTSYLRQAGIQRVQQRTFVLGKGRTESESHRQQRLLAANCSAVVEHMQPVLTNAGYFTDVDYEALVRQVKEELPTLGIVWQVVFAFGTKL
jgi:ubiquinone/menaquinone biosynthesis C-methylase UbiE